MLLSAERVDPFFVSVNSFDHRFKDLRFYASRYQTIRLEFQVNLLFGLDNTTRILTLGFKILGVKIIPNNTFPDKKISFIMEGVHRGKKESTRVKKPFGHFFQ